LTEDGISGVKTKLNKQVVLRHVKTQEYAVSVDGVIEIEENLEPKIFFDGLLDAIIKYVERHNATAGLTMTYEEYAETDDNFGENNGGAEA